MPFTSGTADTAVDLQIAINTHLTANGWTKLTGETDQAAASPKTARYWRINVDEPQNFGDFIEVEEIALRTTLGGANQATVGGNWTITNNASGTGADLIPGTTTTVRSIDLNNAAGMRMTYDFGAGTIIREVAIKCDTNGEAPARFDIEWSHDNVTFTRMWSTRDAGNGDVTDWVANETKVFSFDDGYLFDQHFSATKARRTNYNTTAKGVADHGIFAWQGPGYDASRRVYINMTANYDLAGLTERLILGGGTDFDVNSIGPWSDGALGADPTYTPRHLMGLGPFNYWIYSNSLRVIVICRDGLDDYTMMYAGFMKAFANPDDYPFPIFVGGSSSGDIDMGSTNAAYTWPGDPSDQNETRFRLWDGTWTTVENRLASAQNDIYLTAPLYWTYPYHCGSNGDGNFPFSVVGDNDSFSQHWMDRVVATAQGETFMWPIQVFGRTYGCIGALDGVFALPRAGLYSAEQVITVNAQNYRVFKNRYRTDGHHYYAIRED